MASQLRPYLTEADINTLAERNDIVHQDSELSGLALDDFSTILNCTLSYIQASNCVIVGGTVANSNLKSCTLLRCKLENTKAENSKLKSCTLFLHNYVRRGHTYACDARDSRFVGCCIFMSNIRRSHIQGGKISDNSTIQTTDIKGIVSELECLFSNCKLEGSKVARGLFEGCKLISTSTKNCSVISHPLAFRKFPPEVRTMIFKAAPSIQLMKALRVDSELYNEAMPFFYENIPLVISRYNEIYRNSLPEALLKNIQSVSVRPYHGLSLNRPLDTLKITQIQNLEINFKDGTHELYLFFPCAKYWIKHMSTIKSLSLVVPDVIRSKVDSIVRVANSALHVKGKSGQLENLWGGKITMWRWEAEKGKALTWKDA